jgi:hypothetical protein
MRPHPLPSFCIISGGHLKADLISGNTRQNMIENIKSGFVAGIMGYILFLGILLLTKFVSSIMQTDSNFITESTDFILPVIGFVLLFLIKFLENYKEA